MCVRETCACCKFDSKRSSGDRGAGSELSSGERILVVVYSIVLFLIDERGRSHTKLFMPGQDVDFG
jgi:hypothetical protein